MESYSIKTIFKSVKKIKNAQYLERENSSAVEVDDVLHTHHYEVGLHIH